MHNSQQRSAVRETEREDLWREEPMSEQSAQFDGWELDRKVLPNPQLRQGDLIAFQKAERLQQFGLVVTADCDLTQRKHARMVTLVSVVELVDIVECYLLPELCERKRSQIEAYLSKTFSLRLSLDLPEGRDELKSQAANSTANAALAGACLAAKTILQDVERLTYADYKLVMESAGMQVGQLDERLSQQVQNKGDLLVLPKLDRLEIKADIAWVRHVWQVPLRQIVFRTSELQDGFGQRVARLSSPFRYRLTQLMSQVFSDIGLPNIPRNMSSEINNFLTKGKS